MREGRSHSSLPVAQSAIVARADADHAVVAVVDVVAVVAVIAFAADLARAKID